MSSDEFYATKSFKRRSNWVIAIVAVITLGVIALPFVWAFTGWL